MCDKILVCLTVLFLGLTFFSNGLEVRAGDDAVLNNAYHPGYSLRRETCRVKCRCPPDSDWWGWEVLGNKYLCEDGYLPECCLKVCDVPAFVCDEIPDLCNIDL